MLSLIMCTSDCGSGCFKVLWCDNKSNDVVRMYATISVTHIPEVLIDLLTFMQIVNNLALEPYSKLCSFHKLFVNRNVCQISMHFEEANCAWDN